MRSRPWLFQYETLLEDLGTDPWQADHAAWFRKCNRLPDSFDRGPAMRFVAYPTHARLRALEYERRILQDGEVPSRHDLHDAVNALVWMRFPASKRAISQIHVSDAELHLDSGTRGERRDAATLFDEHGALVVTRDSALVEGLRQHRWRDVLADQAAGFTQKTRVLVFGHALLARLATPHKGLTAHAMPMLWEASDWPSAPQWDELIAARVRTLGRPKDLFPVPVMGLPGWSEHQTHAFYEDTEVFRPLRAQHSPGYSSPLKSNSVTVDAGSAIGE